MRRIRLADDNQISTVGVRHGCVDRRPCRCPPFDISDAGRSGDLTEGLFRCTLGVAGISRIPLDSVVREQRRDGRSDLRRVVEVDADEARRKVAGQANADAEPAVRFGASVDMYEDGLVHA